MIQEHQDEPLEETEDGQVDEGAPGPDRLTNAVRRERLAALQTRIGARAQLDGDVIVIEAGEPVVLHIELDRDATYTLTWWATALTEHGHHRWRDAAAPLLKEGESIHTSALGGGYLVEITQTTRDESKALELAGNPERVERVRSLIATFPDAVVALPEETVPDYLLPPEPELPPLGEVEAEADTEDGDTEEYTANS